jgi:phosphoglycerol transferase MdoB-like AlkP superfamily enzyme
MQFLKTSRIYLLLKLFIVSMIIFIAQKPLFMLYNRDIEVGMGFVDYLSVMRHGLSLDMTVTGYTLIIPFLILSASYFLRINQRRVLMPYYAVVMFVVVLIFVADTVMYSFWHFKLDTTVFLYTDKPSDAAASVSVFFIIATVLAFVLFYALSLTAIYKVLPKNALTTDVNRLRSLLMLPLAPLIFLMIRGGIGDGTANVSRVYFSDSQFLNHSAVNSSFNMLYSMVHQQNFSKEFRYFSDSEECHKLVQDLFPTESTDVDKFVNNRRPNILLIVWESCGGTIAGCTGAETGATPNLDRLAAEGVYFANCHANSFRTDRGLVSINSGWLGLPTASLMKIPQKCESLPGIAKTLKHAGYVNDFWYGGDIAFTNMGGFMIQNGFHKTYSDKDFPLSQRSSRWGVPDEHLFDRVMSDIENRKSTSPWFTEIMTLSSHEPWKVPYRRLNKDIENSFAYTDHCIGMFINRLKTMPVWKNTLVIIVPDHGVLSDPKYSLSSYEVAHIPLVFTGGAAAGSRTITTLMNQSDIAATLLGQLGIPHGDFIFSRDVMSSTYKVPSAIHTSKIEMTFHDSLGYTTLDLVSEKPVFNSGRNPDLRILKGKAVLQTLYEDTARR